jgi:glycosyltransferase involved in cell wall biosynthesis
MRVALTVEQSWASVPGGTAVATIGLAQALARRSDLDVIGVAARHARPAPREWELPVPVRHLGLPTRTLFEAWHKLRWPAVERATGPVDVVHGTIIAVPASHAPLLLTIHDLAFLSHPEHFTSRGVRFFERALQLALREARMVTCPSEATIRACVAAGFEVDRLRLVPWGVRAQAVSAAVMARCRSRYGLERPFILFCGTVEPRKNLHRVLRAFRDLDHRELDLLIAGPKGWREDIGEALTELEGRARWLGSVPAQDLMALYADAALVVYPSLEEGFGFPVLEAMAQGAPVVTSSGTATEEVAGDAALLVDPLDTKAIADAMGRLLNDHDLARRLGEAGRARAATYTWERSGELMAGIYAEVVGGSA